MPDGQIAQIQYEHDGTFLQEQQVRNQTKIAGRLCVAAAPREKENIQLLSVSAQCTPMFVCADYSFTAPRPSSRSWVFIDGHLPSYVTKKTSAEKHLGKVVKITSIKYIASVTSENRR